MFALKDLCVSRSNEKQAQVNFKCLAIVFSVLIKESNIEEIAYL